MTRKLITTRKSSIFVPTLEIATFVNFVWNATTKSTHTDALLLVLHVVEWATNLNVKKNVYVMQSSKTTRASFIIIKYAK